MPGRLELRRWIQLYQKGYAVAQAQDGHYVAVGTETGAAVYNLGGHQLAHYTPGAGEIPVHRVCAPLDFARLALATRLGNLVMLDLAAVPGRLEVMPHEFPMSIPDMHTLAFSAATERIAVGHLSYALTMLNGEGEVLWQQQDVDAAALGTMWTVAFAPGGSKLYVGSAGSGTNWLAALDAASGALLYRRECAAPVIGVAALPDRLGVATLSPGEYYTEARLTAYTPDLSDVLWEEPLNNPATAIYADEVEPMLAVGAGIEGVVTLFNAETGAVLATETLNALVEGLSLVQGKSVAAVTQDRAVGLLRYLP